MCDAGKAVEIHRLGERHSPAVDLERLVPPLPVGNSDLDLAVELPGPAQRRIQRVGNVRGGDDDYLSACLEAIHQGEELSDDASLDLARPSHFLALGRDGIDLVDENDGGSVPLRLLEQLAQMRLACAVELVDNLRAVDVNEVHIGFVGDGAGDQRLAGAGRPVEQNALGRLDAEVRKHFRVSQGQLDDLSDAAHLPMQPSDVLVGDGFTPPLGATLAGDGRRRRDDDRTRRRRLRHNEASRLRADRIDAHPVARHHRHAIEQAGQVAPFEAARGTSRSIARRQYDRVRLLGRRPPD